MTAGMDLAYLLAAVLFIQGLKRLSTPDTARLGNALAALGMFVAVLATLVGQRIVHPAAVFGGIAVGAAVGVLLARSIAMTAMPQMVALLNGFGGGASALVAAATLLAGGVSVRGTAQLSVVIGSLTLAGSLVAFAKLQSLMTDRALVYRMQQPLNALVLLVTVLVAVRSAALPEAAALFGLLAGLGLLFGVLVVLPVGGADMPVVISLLNAASGLAAASTGFVLQNYGLIISGALVGAAGLILTQVMCRAMNRSLASVLFGGFGAERESASPGAPATVREISVTDAAMLLAYSRLVIVVPGYGLAAAQAQHQARELSDLLQARGVEVRYAIHPVAGRMPGHMNVLLAEANVPYERLWELDRSNAALSRTDVVLVIGANDVVNPAAKSDPAGPIYGMPIVEVERAAQVIVLKRSLRPGFAGIDNRLFYGPKTAMLFGDARESLNRLIAAVKAA